MFFEDFPLDAAPGSAGHRTILPRVVVLEV